MATLTRAQMINKVLQRLGVLGAGQSSSAADAELVGGVLDSVHTQYRKLRMASFETSAFPEWAQEPFCKIIAADAGPYFGFRDSLANENRRLQGERELARQMDGGVRMPQARARYY